MNKKTLEQTLLELALAKSNLETLIARDWDTDDDHNEVRWLELEVKRLS